MTRAANGADANSVPRNPAGPLLAVVLKGYPRLSETFIAQEILALERKGLNLQLFSLRHPTDRAVHPIHGDIRAKVTYLPEYLKDERLRVWRSWRQARRLAGYPLARNTFLQDYRRDRTVNRIRRFGQACVLAAELPATTNRVYAHFLHTPTSVARYAALMRGLPCCASAHAKDIWTSPDWDVRDKLDSLDWLVTCTASGCAHLRSLAAVPEKVALVYHGLDFTRFPLAAAAKADVRDGSNPADPVRLLSVGRAVEKKGYDVLFQALAQLPKTLRWQLTHIGGGLESDRLKDLAEDLGLTARIDWRGAQPHDVVLTAYRQSDLFVLASKVAHDGDRDGLPNVLMEAQSQALCCLATQVSAIPELIRDGETGVLVPPADPARLADALAGLIADPAARTRLGAAGCKRVRSNFSMEAGIDDLFQRLGGPAATLAAE